MKETVNKTEEKNNEAEILFENIVNDEFSKEFKVVEIEEKFKHLSGKFLLVCGTKDDIDRMESAFDEYEIDVLRWDGSKIAKPNKEGFSDPAFDWNGQYLFIPKNTKEEIVDEGDHFVVKCFMPKKR